MRKNAERSKETLKTVMLSLNKPIKNSLRMYGFQQKETKQHANYKFEMSK